MTQQPSGLFLSHDFPKDEIGRSSEDIARLLDDIRVAVKCSPGVAREAALRLVTLLSEPLTQSEPMRGGLAPWQKRKVERHLKEHFAEAPLVDELAAQVSLSASHFGRVFKESFGTPPHVYIVGLRLELAKDMLRSTLEPLSQIAIACGFSDQSHLCKTFRREIGETPGAWRRRHFGAISADSDATRMAA